MTRRMWAGAVLGFGLMACGPMPGYISEPSAPTPSAPPAKAESPRVSAPGPSGEAGSEVVSEPLPAPAKPAVPRAPARREAPPAYEPPQTPEYDPAEDQDAPPAPSQPPIFRPSQRIPEPAPSKSGMQTIRLDDDSYYLVDAARGVCFFRHKDVMAPVDCSKIPESGGEDAPAPERARAPTQPPRLSRPPAQPPALPPEPELEPEAEPEPPTQPTTRPAQAPKLQASPDEMLRFERAYDAIFCDRKRGDTTAPDQRIRAQGLTTARYEAIEGWWADDENAWWTLTERARRACK